jgi:hypothetical protein
LIIECQRHASLDEERDKDLHTFEQLTHSWVGELSAPYLVGSTIATIAMEQFARWLERTRVVLLYPALEILGILKGVPGQVVLE